MRQLKALWRIARVLSHVLAGAWRIRMVFPRLTQPERDAEVQAWALAMLARLAIKLVVNGTPPASGPVLLAANHISWLDIVVIHAARHCRFISKADIQHWPVVGTLATGAGTLYIERESRRDAMRVVHHMAERLSLGEVLAVFPEGTTGDGTGVLPFHANLLQAAISAGAPIQPVALQFLDAEGQQSFAPCYVGDDTLLSSLWRTLCSDGIQVVVSFGALQTANGRDRRALAEAAREDIIALRQR
ncbi:MAG: lysophospholipid acyltransferase family protein [Rhodoferax sp.]|uniref:lysophospholipid acyltransferase family protein n=1 Tax=Rhodoferax sp. TaxID=50421 RepID=UPI002ACEF3AB|nr:lysophospholipid acyltransferase family protein [Rhodoferax sp.]MDZ7891155.1 lysophospholipid acyltransferase family protein [Rhodoferax sp.]